jgi:hypothetical protein
VYLQEYGNSSPKTSGHWQAMGHRTSLVLLSDSPSTARLAHLVTACPCRSLIYLSGTLMYELDLQPIVSRSTSARKSTARIRPICLSGIRFDWGQQLSREVLKIIRRTLIARLDRSAWVHSYGWHWLRWEILGKATHAQTPSKRYSSPSL